VIGVVGHLHLHQHIAGEEFALRVDLAAAADLDDVLGRHQDFRETVLEPLLARLIRQVLGDLLLEVRIGVDDVPLVPGIGGGLGAASVVRRVSYWPSRDVAREPRQPASTTKKKIAAMRP
jgi:hypothetical protein